MTTTPTGADASRRLIRAQQFADRIRLRAARMVAPHGFGYLGQALSSAELLGTLASGFWRPGRDTFVLSPGHYVVAVYAVAVELGLIDEDDLATYGHDGSRLPAIGTESSPGADLTCGSLGQGLSAAIGFALADRLRGSDADTYALISDGELQEGQVWEAAMFAGHHDLSRLTVLLDLNNSQVDGPVDEVTTIEPVAAKWAAFGWDVSEVDGHDVAAVDTALEAARRSSRPAIVVATTSTRHGVAALPADADGHFIKLPSDLAARVVAELEARVDA